MGQRHVEAKTNIAIISTDSRHQYGSQTITVFLASSHHDQQEHHKSNRCIKRSSLVDDSSQQLGVLQQPHFKP